jgi:hypothetical protein
MAILFLALKNRFIFIINRFLGINIGDDYALVGFIMIINLTFFVTILRYWDKIQVGESSD